jgi:hypothetical protein
VYDEYWGREWHDWYQFELGDLLSVQESGSDEEIERRNWWDDREGGDSDPVTFAQAQKMPYLQAVLKEALRMHPATGLPLGRVVPEGGALIAGKMFPAGVSIPRIWFFLVVADVK